MCRTVTNCLEHIGYDDVVKAQNGVVALEELLKGDVDVVGAVNAGVPWTTGVVLPRQENGNAEADRYGVRLRVEGVGRVDGRS
jgi:ABC-type proline/glycine betaine transport system substrate-binding protein